MRLEVLRFSSGMHDTLGLFFDVTSGRRFLSFTLEDEFRTRKVQGETRIPAGTYLIKLRTEGGFHNKYKEKFPTQHRGMLWITNVPGFEYILIHIGNAEEDTDGCLLVGDTIAQNLDSRGFLGNSTAAYVRVYGHIARALEKGEKVEITFVDFDRTI